MISRSLPRLYPAAWRARDGDELAALLADVRPTLLAPRRAFAARSLRGSPA